MGTCGLGKSFFDGGKRSLYFKHFVVIYSRIEGYWGGRERQFHFGARQEQYLAVHQLEGDRCD